MSSLNVNNIYGTASNGTPDVYKSQGAKLYITFLNYSTISTSFNVASYVDIGVGQCNIMPSNSMAAPYYPAINDVGWPSVTWGGIHSDTQMATLPYVYAAHLEAATFRDAISESIVQYGVLA